MRGGAENFRKDSRECQTKMTGGTGDAYQEWNMQQMVDSFRKELELRERASQFFGKNKGVVTKKQFGKSGGQTTASVLFSKNLKVGKGIVRFVWGITHIAIVGRW